MSVGHRLPDYIDHMLQAAQQAVAYVQGMDKAAFMADVRTQQAVLMNIVVLGEAAGRVLAEFPDFAERQSAVPWRSIRGMRNRVAHAYFEINLDLVWETVLTALPELAARLPEVRRAAQQA
ncbi:MAG TPA: DUF86 domain-containing protein [Rubrivivax sp.]|nr:DUF86 domain-containing protein [Rubrivivax sp.]